MAALRDFGITVFWGSFNQSKEFVFSLLVQLNKFNENAEF